MEPIEFIRALRRRPRGGHGDRDLPILLVSDLTGLAREPEPRAVVSGAGDDVAGLVGKIARELHRSRTGERPLRFQLTTKALRVISFTPSPDGHDPEGEARRHLAAPGRTEFAPPEQGGGSALAKWQDFQTYGFATFSGSAILGAIATAGRVTSTLVYGVIAVVSGVAALAQLVFRVRDAPWYPRYRWFTRQPYLEAEGASLVGFTVSVAREAQETDRARLVVAALLEDLARAYRRPWWRRVGWARVTYPMVVLEDAHDPAGSGFLALVEQVRNRRGGHDPLLVVARASLGPPSGDAYTGFRSRMAWGRRADGDHFVELHPAGTHARPSPPGRTRRPWLAHPLLTWITGLALLAATVTVVALDRDLRCAQTWIRKEGGQCVGVINASGLTPDGFVHPNLREIVDSIDRRNVTVADQRSFVTFGVLGEFTLAGEHRRDSRLAGAFGELVGLWHLQMTVEKPSVRLLLVNAGDNFAHGERAAKLVADYARTDPTFAGVVGLGRSVEGVKRAVGVLDAAKIPMVITSATASDVGGTSRYAFRVAATNEREGALLARYVRRRLLAEVAAPKAVVVSDKGPGEVYSGDLARVVSEEFAKETGGSKPLHVDYTDPGQLTRAAGAACDAAPDVYFFTGRGPELPTFLNRLGTTTCGSPKGRLVVAGDDASKELADNPKLGQDTGMTLVYATFGERTAVPGAPEFVKIAEDLFRDRKMPLSVRPSGSNAAIGFAGGTLLHHAASQAKTPDAPVALGDVLYYLSTVREDRPLYSATGMLAYASGEPHDGVDKLVTVVNLENAERVHCGRARSQTKLEADELCLDLPGSSETATAGR
ncbi:hypothetical protein ACIBG7_05040 [Nonomuraea sp. NPDC050328]|uniref:hypothetical protein n=1 Tax=Nonomuraea sp. NPDC050328 TaxID=3364361 RepID=UPI00379FBE92